jgi:hypothetical protein
MIEPPHTGSLSLMVINLTLSSSLMATNDRSDSEVDSSETQSVAAAGGAVLRVAIQLL